MQKSFNFMHYAHYAHYFCLNNFSCQVPSNMANFVKHRLQVQYCRQLPEYISHPLWGPFLSFYFDLLKCVRRCEICSSVRQIALSCSPKPKFVIVNHYNNILYPAAFILFVILKKFACQENFKMNELDFNLYVIVLIVMFGFS